MRPSCPSSWTDVRLLRTDTQRTSTRRMATWTVGHADVRPTKRRTWPRSSAIFSDKPSSSPVWWARFSSAWCSPMYRIRVLEAPQSLPPLKSLQHAILRGLALTVPSSGVPRGRGSVPQAIHHECPCAEGRREGSARRTHFAEHGAELRAAVERLVRGVDQEIDRVSQAGFDPRQVATQDAGQLLDALAAQLGISRSDRLQGPTRIVGTRLVQVGDSQVQQGDVARYVAATERVVGTRQAHIAQFLTAVETRLREQGFPDGTVRGALTQNAEAANTTGGQLRAPAAAAGRRRRPGSRL